MPKFVADFARRRWETGSTDIEAADPAAAMLEARRLLDDFDVEFENLGGVADDRPEVSISEPGGRLLLREEVPAEEPVELRQALGMIAALCEHAARAGSDEDPVWQQARAFAHRLRDQGVVAADPPEDLVPAEEEVEV